MARAIELTHEQRETLNALRSKLQHVPVGADGRADRRYLRVVRSTAEARLKRLGLNQWDAKRLVDNPSIAEPKQ